MLTTGIIGCGGAARGRHLPVIDTLDGLELEWVCDLDKDRAVSTADEYGVDHYVNPDTAIGEAPDVIHVCSPPSTHADIAVDVLRAGSHVLVEKPMAMTVDECQKMTDAAEETGRKLSVVHNNLFLAPSREVLAEVENGDFGEILGVTAHLGRERNPSETREWVDNLHGGAAGEHLPHPLYLATHFLGEIDDVSVSLKCDDAGDVIGADIQVTDEDDVFASIQYMREAPPMKRYTVYGTRKRASVDLFNYVNIGNTTREPSKSTIVTDNISEAFQLLFGTASNLFQYAKYAITGSGDLLAPGHYTLIKQFRDSVKHNAEVPIMPKDGAKVVRILEEIDSSDPT